MKIKVKADVINRGGKRFVAVDGYIDVNESDLEYFDGFIQKEAKKIEKEVVKQENVVKKTRRRAK